MQHAYTIVWRPASADDFRVDFVAFEDSEGAPDNNALVVRCIEENSDIWQDSGLSREETVDLVINSEGYELITAFYGHCIPYC